MEFEKIVEFLKANHLTQQLSEEEIQSLKPYVDIKHVRTDERVFNEQDSGEELYLVESGSFEIYKHLEELKQEELLGKIEKGDFFGEMAHLEKEPRSASVRATTDGALIVFKLQEIEQKKELESLYAKIMTAVAKKMSAHLRQTDGKLIDRLKEHLSVVRNYAQISKEIIYFVIIFVFWFNVLHFIELVPEYGEQLRVVIASFLLVLFSIILLFVIRTSDHPYAFYGLTWKRWLPRSFWSLMYSLPSLVVLLCVKVIVVHFFESFRGLPLFASGSLLFEKRYFILAYAVTVPFQEFIARGCIQTSFRLFFKGKHSVFLSIFISNLLFELIHTVSDLWVALCSLIFGLFWGWLFERHRSLISVSLSHAVIGIWAFFILDMDAVLQIFNKLYGS